MEKSDKTVEQSATEPGGAVKYYEINETTARRAKEMNSFYGYKPGSATAEYRRCVDAAAQLAEQQKKHVDPMYHEQIDRLLDTYSRKLAENMNRSNEIDTRVPSVMIAGPSNFPVRKKEKQNSAREKNMEEWRHIQGLLDKIRSIGTGGISTDDPHATNKLESKLAECEQLQDFMKSVNVYYRKNKTLDGCPGLTADQIESMKAAMARDWRKDPAPFASYQLTNNNAEIRRLKTRIEELKQHQEKDYPGWSFDGGTVEANKADNRLQIFFDAKPPEEHRAALKSNGFRWAPSVGAWQRQLNSNAYYAAERLTFIQPAIIEKPTDLQQKSVQEQGDTVMPTAEQFPVDVRSAGQPLVTVTFSEHDQLRDALKMPIYLADALFAELDAKPGADGAPYYKTDFRVDFIRGGEFDTYTGHYDVGVGNGSLIDHIQVYAEYYRRDEGYQQRLADKGSGERDAFNAQIDVVRTELVPFFRMHCKLSEREAEASSELMSIHDAAEGDPSDVAKVRIEYLEAVVEQTSRLRTALNTTGMDGLPEFLRSTAEGVKDQPARDFGGRASVLDQIKTSRQAPKPPVKREPERNKKTHGPEL